jgi:citrate lyase subunit beta/citryl-CoA lyase
VQADSVIRNLKKAGGNDSNASARTNLTARPNKGGTFCERIHIRGNSFHDAHTSVTIGAPDLPAGLVPEVKYLQVLAELSDILVMIALLETALGPERTYVLAVIPGLARIAFVSVEIVLEVSTEETVFSMLLVSPSLVVAFRRVGIVCSINGVTVLLDYIHAPRMPDAVTNDGAKWLDGQMVDLPSAIRARPLLQQAKSEPFTNDLRR